MRVRHARCARLQRAQQGGQRGPDYTLRGEEVSVEWRRGARASKRGGSLRGQGQTAGAPSHYLRGCVPVRPSYRFRNPKRKQKPQHKEFQNPSRAGGDPVLPPHPWFRVSFFLSSQTQVLVCDHDATSAVCMTCWKLSCWTCGENEGVHAQSAPRRRRRRQHRKLDGTSYSPAPARCLLP